MPERKSREAERKVFVTHSKQKRCGYGPERNETSAVFSLFCQVSAELHGAPFTIRHTIRMGRLRSSTQRDRVVYDGTRESGLVLTLKLTMFGVRRGFDRKRGAG